MEDNPYRPPQAPLQDTPGIGDERTLPEHLERTEAELRAFVGKNAGYYLKKWASALANEGGSSGFSGAAFLFSGLWLPYRKMYKFTLILYGIVLAETVLEAIVPAALGGAGSGAEAFGGLFGLAIWIVCGRYGNAWYLNHVKQRIAEVRARGLQDDDYFKELARAGGTNLPAAFGLFLLFIVVVSAVSAMLTGQ